MPKKITDFITNFVNELLIYDYIFFGSIFVLFILLVTLGIILRGKPLLATFFILLAFTAITAGSYFGYNELHTYLFSNKLTIKSQKKLTFTQAVIVNGNIKNTSKMNFKSCMAVATVYKKDPLEIKELILRLKPIKKVSIIEKDIKKGETRNIKIIIEPFTYKKEYKIFVEAECK
jgi:hypothetical protein